MAVKTNADCIDTAWRHSGLSVSPAGHRAPAEIAGELRSDSDYYGAAIAGRRSADFTTATCFPMDYLDLIQWPAMVASVVAAWLVGAQSKGRRKSGFWWFLASNVLWIAWGWHTRAWALIALQFALVTLNIRGARKNESG
jgi:hypothetical protein